MNGQAWWLSPNDEDVDLDCIPGALGARIRQERVRLGFDRKVFAQRIGVGEQRLKSMENGAGKMISAVELAAMANSGADIAYVLTAKKSIHLKPDEVAVVDNYRNSTPSGQASLREVGTAFAQQAEAVKKTRGK